MDAIAILVLVCVNIYIVVRQGKKLNQKINDIDKKINNISLDYEDLSDEKKQTVDAILTGEAKREKDKSTQYTD